MAIIDKPSDYFNTKLYTGDGGTQSVTGVGFQPDWTWIKNRGSTDSHNVYDAVRGVTKYLLTNNTVAEGTTSGVTAFNSDGFSVGNNSMTNSNSNNYASWNWKAGTSASGATTGSGTAKTFSSSSNSESGFSIVKYVGNGTSNHAIPHGCGTAPKMIIVKTTTKASQAWPVDCRQVGGILYLNTTQSTDSYGDTSPFTSVAPTSSVFSIGSPGNVNYNNDTYIAYCFAEKQGYSKFGSYTGNGSTDGTFVYTGFKPAFVIIKITSGTGNWNIFDIKRDGYNGENENLSANLSDAESAGNNRIDILSNGFKVRASTADVGSSGATYIYMAFAENPFVTSTDNGSIPACAR